MQVMLDYKAIKHGILHVNAAEAIDLATLASTGNIY